MNDIWITYVFCHSYKMSLAHPNSFIKLFPHSSVGKESACNAGDHDLIPGSGRSTGEGLCYPPQCSWPSLWLSWERICLQCGRSGFDPWVGKIPWRRERLPTPEFWPWEFHGLYIHRVAKSPHEWATVTHSLKITVDNDCSHEIKRCLLLGGKAMTNLDNILKSRDINFANKGLCSQSCGFTSSRVWMWELGHRESWAPQNWCFWTVMLKKTLESALDWKEIKPVNPEGDQSWVFIGRTDAEAEAPILWPPDAKNRLIGKDRVAEKDWRWEEKGTTEDEMVGWHHWLSWPEFEWAPGVGDGQGGLACCSPWGHKESDTTEQLNWTEAVYIFWKSVPFQSHHLQIFVPIL